MIKSVFFDLGNVILPFDLLRLARRLSRYSPFSAEEIRIKIWTSDVEHKFETGQLSDLDYFNHVTTTCQLKDLPYNEFIPIFNDIFDEDPHVFDLIAQLKEKYNLGLISNTNAIHVNYIRSTYKKLAHFGKLWFSNEAGMRKPDPKFFELALNHFKCSPAESVFIDDMEVNIHSARKIGMNAIHYRGFDELKTELSKIGVTH